MDIPALAMKATDFWASVAPVVPSSICLSFIEQIATAADARRVRADYDTGSVTAYEAYLLWSLAFRARVVIEVGTFIGTSTHALAAGNAVQAVYTCDVSNDCLAATDVIHPYPKVTSTVMLMDLCKRGVRADLCFFDGVLNLRDADLLRNVTHLETVFAFHDYNYGPKQRKRGLETMPRKGIGNVNLLRPHLPAHVLIEPRPETTLALLVPESRL